MECIKEEEIKIEYFESLEVDPLLECNTAKMKSFCSEDTLMLTKSLDCNFNRNSLSVEGQHKESQCTQENESSKKPQSDCKHGIACELSVEGQHKERQCTQENESSKKPQSDCKHGIACEETTAWYSEIDACGKYKCKLCNLTYSTVQTLRNHTKFKHPNEVGDIRNYSIKNKRKKVLKCHICNRNYKSLTLLEMHVHENHLENLEKSCQYCDASFSSQTEVLSHILSKHQVVHKKMFLCITCGYRTMKLSHYKQHSRTHQADCKITCQYCEYSTHYKPNLKIHERIHTAYKPYVCCFEGCGYRSSAKTALTSHQLKHAPEKNMLLCDKCSYKTVYKQCLKRHIASHERDMRLDRKIVTDTNWSTDKNQLHTSAFDR